MAFLTLARAAALIWLLPALLFNVDWSGHGSWQANAAAVVMILGSALFIEGALRFRSLVLTPLCVVAALFLVFVNTKQATRTLSFASEAASEAKQAKIDAGSHLASQRSQLENRRKMQAQLVGEVAAGTLDAELMQLKAREARRWNATNGCEDGKITTSASFCAQVAELTGKIETARKRDEIDVDLRKLPMAPVVAGEVVAVPTVADSYVANIKAVANEMGYQPTERIIRAEEAMSRALGFELLAALGPTCWLAFLNAVLGIGAAAASASSSARFRAMSKRLQKADAPAPTAESKADAIDRWIADTLEVYEGVAMYPAQMRSTPGWPAASRGEEQAIWKRLQRLPGVRHDRNNGRPRYIGLRLKRAAPTLVVVSNAEMPPANQRIAA